MRRCKRVCGSYCCIFGMGARCGYLNDHILSPFPIPSSQKYETCMLSQTCEVAGICSLRETRTCGRNLSSCFRSNWFTSTFSLLVSLLHLTISHACFPLLLDILPTSLCRSFEAHLKFETLPFFFLLAPPSDTCSSQTYPLLPTDSTNQFSCHHIRNGQWQFKYQTSGRRNFEQAPFQASMVSTNDRPPRST